jgi:hypothetical protein
MDNFGEKSLEPRVSGGKFLDNIVQASGEFISEGEDQSNPHTWSTPCCGDIDIRVDGDGNWYYMNSLIKRDSLVKLFSSILVYESENNEYFLLTPAEKMRIQVDDVPFVITDVERYGDPVSFLCATTNVGETLVIGNEHPIKYQSVKDRDYKSVYISVRDNLLARFDRKAFYRLIDMGNYIQRGDNLRWFGVRSGNIFFPFAKEEELH